MKSLFLQCTLAAVVAAGTSASLSMAQDTRVEGARSGIAAQITALGLDQAAVKATLDGLSRDERITYLQNLGVRLPETVARPLPALADGAAPQFTTSGTLQSAGQIANVKIDSAGVVTTLPSRDGGRVTIQPWPLPSVDGNTSGTVGITPGRIISSDGKTFDLQPTDGVVMITPAQPAKP